MSANYPNDADGDALRRVAADGNDMSSPMDVDFPVVFCSEQNARQFNELVERFGYKTEVQLHDDDSDWDVNCVKRMILTYDSVIEVQKQLDELSEKLGGYSDGWGTFGNKS